MLTKTKDKIHSYDDGCKNYIVFYMISYDESYRVDKINNLSCKCFKYEYTEIVAKSAKEAVEIAKEILPARLKESIRFNSYRDKKNVKLHSIEEVYVQTTHERELV